MEIRIDTSRDSKEDIRKAIGFLQTIVGDAPDSGNARNSFNSETASVLGSMFGDDTPPPPSQGDGEVPAVSSDKITVIPY